MVLLERGGDSDTRDVFDWYMYVVELAPMGATSLCRGGD